MRKAMRISAAIGALVLGLLTATGTTALAGPTAIYGPYATSTICLIEAHNGIATGKWNTAYCAQDGTPFWWIHADQ